MSFVDPSWWFLRWVRGWGRRRGTVRVSLLVPFRADDDGRQRNWDWLQEYWERVLPDAEIVIGKDTGVPFSKTAAVNYAARRARGRIFVILDADAILPVWSILEAAARIERAARDGNNLWFVPYRYLYRMTEEATEELLQTNPDFGLPPIAIDQLLPFEGSHHGRRFGAMCQVMPREAFFAAGGMDPRFRGWGGEDVSFVRAVDTLWGKHKTIEGDIYHLYHHKIGVDWRTRVWKNQQSARVNENLASRYDRATDQVDVMQALVDEFQPKKKWWQRG